MNGKLETLEKRAASGMERVLSSVPFARDFHEGISTQREYYTRHLIEGVLRIRLNNEADAYCLFKIIRAGGPTAEHLLHYLAEEYGHDEMLAKDLIALGITRDQLEATRPLFSTELLIGFLRSSVDEDGPLPTFLWNWLVEWYSDRYNSTIVARARDEFGAECAAGTGEHLEIDKQLGHEAGIGMALLRMIESDSAMDRALAYVDRFVELVGMYFEELYDATIGRRKAR